MVKNPPAITGDTRYWGSIPGSGRSRGVENSNPLHSVAALFVISILGWEISWTEEPGGLQSMGL